MKTFYGTKAVFDAVAVRYHIPKYAKPVLGAFLIGVLIIALSYLSPETMMVGLASFGSGYGFVQMAMYNMLPLSVLILLPVAKTVTTSLTIGSGGSGGVFAPGLAVGGFAGGEFGMFLHLILPELVPLASVPAFVIVGMLALFGGISHAPIAIMIMVLEMTGDFSLFVPAMGAVAVAYMLIGKQTIFHEQRACAGMSRRSTGTDGTPSERFVNSEFRVHFLFFENEVTEIFSILSSPMRERRIFSLVV